MLYQDIEKRMIVNTSFIRAAGDPIPQKKKSPENDVAAESPQQSDRAPLELPHER
jgi:hypothetical protein